MERKNKKPSTRRHRLVKITTRDPLFRDLLGKEIMLTMSASQLNLLGQTFRPIFTGTVREVTDSYVQLSPVTIKMSNAPFFRFPTPLNFPIERITSFLPFDADTRFPIP
ncbi:hypothetical protein [Paenibacillus sp. YYML68]|uniref:hypothetical protein n=1 Tax=Paenibacillus sp. YYML68 TaxID=2909250 RepID=UPI00248FFE50|nr:hypothetical protein [Paenibacillus sp. YYML68]